MIARLSIILALICLFFPSCSREEKGIRTIRAHTFNKKGVGHPGGAVHAERYCQLCHGAQLFGGSAAQPSCYKCHGQHWAAVDAQFVFAPANHTLNLGGYMHHAATDQAAAVCSGCHGEDLSGNGESGPPSCLLCHAEVW